MLEALYIWLYEIKAGREQRLDQAVYRHHLRDVLMADSQCGRIDRRLEE
jgi:hypothetical protein